MTNRHVFIILGLVIIVLGFAGIGLYQANKEKNDAIKQLELIKQREEAKARAAEQERKAQEQRQIAEQIEKQKEIEKQKTIEKQREWIAEQERKKRQEEARRAEEEYKRRVELERQRRLAEEKRAREEQQRRARELAAQKERETRARTLSFGVTIGPLEDPKAIRVAHVHQGDQVTIDIERHRGSTYDKFYVGLVPLNFQKRESYVLRRPNRRSRSSLLGSFARPERIRERVINALVKSPISDHDRFTVYSGINAYGNSSGWINSKDGAALCVGTGKDRNLTSGQMPSSYTIRITIYANNPWNINARRM